MNLSRIRQRRRVSSNQLCSCGKRRFRDHRAAVHALHSEATERASNPDSYRRESRTYECDLCIGWHLASKPARVGLSGRTRRGALSMKGLPADV
jgi:hypothetical protein